ncbi:MAG: mitochondrial fission ELM1 family protein [Pseudomonadota bacterium]
MAEKRAQTDNSSGASPLQRDAQALILTDGKMGDLAHCRGVASVLGMNTTEHVVQPSKLAAALGRASNMKAFLSKLENLSPQPVLAIASGRRTVPYLKAVKTRFGQNLLTLFLKDPRTGAETADLIWVPTHDKLRGANVLVTNTAPHRYTSDITESAAEELAKHLPESSWPRPWLGVVLGGVTGSVRYEAQTVTALRDAIVKASTHAGAVLVTPSRRTPADVLDGLMGLHSNVWIWDGHDPNPYAGMLGACDAFLVTGDSHNMVSEVLSAGRQTMVFRPAGLPTKFTRFLDSMSDNGAILVPEATSFDHHQAPIDATPVIANWVTDALKTRGLYV